MIIIVNNLCIILKCKRFYLLLRNFLFIYQIPLIYLGIKKEMNEACIISLFTINLTPPTHSFNSIPHRQYTLSPPWNRITNRKANVINYITFHIEVNNIFSFSKSSPFYHSTTAPPSPVGRGLLIVEAS